MSLTLQYDVAVVGVGAMGAATSEALARRGVRVVGIERHDPGHELGSSGGETRLIRKAYAEHPDYVPLVQRAYREWRKLEERSRRRVLLRTGCLYAGPAEGGAIAATLEAARLHDLDIEVLSSVDRAKRFPQFVLPEEMQVLFDREAGVLLSQRAIETQAELAKRQGADIRCGETVVDWQDKGDSVSITTDRSTLEVGHVVFTAGAWTSGLLAELDLGLRVHRQVLSWVEPPEAGRFTIGSFPAWMIEPPSGGSQGSYYGFPVLSGEQLDKVSGCPLSARGLKVALHYPGPQVDADQVNREPTLEDEEQWRSALGCYLPSAGTKTLASKVCLYTTSQDEHFIVDRHPLHHNVTIACGFSGHGFKFASALGEALADLALEGQTSLPIDFLGLARFNGPGIASS